MINHRIGNTARKNSNTTSHAPPIIGSPNIYAFIIALSHFFASSIIFFVSFVYFPLSSLCKPSNLGHPIMKKTKNPVSIYKKDDWILTYQFICFFISSHKDASPHIKGCVLLCASLEALGSRSYLSANICKCAISSLLYF